MRHAGPKSLRTLAPLRTLLLRLPGLRERKKGVLYRGATAFLHFHEDPTGLFADLKRGREWVRFPVNSARERRALLAAARLGR